MTYTLSAELARYDKYRVVWYKGNRESEIGEGRVVCQLVFNHRKCLSHIGIGESQP